MKDTPATSTPKPSAKKEETPTEAKKEQPVKAESRPTPVQSNESESKPKKEVVKELQTNFVMTGDRQEHREKISVLRRKVAHRLKESQNTNALLTTFNEIDMGHIIDVRKRFVDEFKNKHNIKLGFMGFFLKASAYALESYPIVNSVISGSEIIHRN